jgi:hypothetical protein
MKIQWWFFIKLQNRMTILFSNFAFRYLPKELEMGNIYVVYILPCLIAGLFHNSEKLEAIQVCMDEK